ncbi:alpha/beta hydrolase fold domain-containing protein [Sandarakinorhabdus sp. DWP1-3-1]|uniref:alpha/beta hydrolase fold domain-containing protein n=1 Tax=Sandarakinorhabdus sp. DWP1-3-1 TaxID=2804627 RepID=UPI003CF53955
MMWAVGALDAEMTMMRFGLSLALLLCLAAPVIAQDSSELRYKAEAKTAAPPALVARYGADDLRSGELRLPPGKGPFPVAVVIHGGCWTASYDTRAGIAGVADALTKRGIATWNIEYRRMGDPGAGWPGTFEDIGAGIDHLAVLAKTQPIDLSRVALIGHSSGAHLALWGASRGRLGPRFAPAVKPAAVVAIDGPGALAPFVGIDAKVCGQPVIVPLMGGTPDKAADAYALASPADHLPLGVRQYLVMAAFKPFMAPYAAAAKAAGDTVEVIEGSDDHFGVVTPSTADGKKTIDFIVDRAFAR